MIRQIPKEDSPEPIFWIYKMLISAWSNFTETMSKMYFSVTKMSFSGGIGTPGSENRYNSFPSTGEYV